MEFQYICLVNTLLDMYNELQGLSIMCVRYTQHIKQYLHISFRFAKASIASLIHGFCPFLFSPTIIEKYSK